MEKDLIGAELAVTIICSTLILLLIATVYSKLNKRLSVSFTLILSLYGFGCIMRILKLLIVNEVSEQISSLINVFTLCVLLFSLQYFIFVVIEYKARIES
jgi:hypothetical protein